MRITMKKEQQEQESTVPDINNNYWPRCRYCGQFVNPDKDGIKMGVQYGFMGVDFDYYYHVKCEKGNEPQVFINNNLILNKMENLTTIVKGTTAKLTHVCHGKVYYQIDTGNHKYQLEIDSMENEFKTTYLELEFKAITLMRWIRKGIENGTFIELS
jgi:hypothetical protein